MRGAAQAVQALFRLAGRFPGVAGLWMLLWCAASAGPVSAQSGDTEPAGGKIHVWRNPVAPAGTSGRQPARRAAQTAVPQVTCTSTEELASALHTYASQRAPALEARLHYDFAFRDVQDLIGAAVEQALFGDDYLRFTFSNYAARYQGTDGDATVEFQLEYMTSAAQEEYVDQRVSDLQARLFSATMNAEQREIAAHDWVVTHVQYDQDGATGDLRYTAYGALSQGVAVCQGYALLTYRLLQAAGLEARIVSGTAGGQDHAWNLVEVCGAWYHLDATWDDPVRESPEPERVNYAYFNRSDVQMRKDHTWKTDGFPAAPEEYTSGVCAGHVQRLSWSTDREQVFQAAQAADKQVLVVVGHPDGVSTRYLLETVCQWYYPRVRPLLMKDFLVLLCDEAATDAWQSLAAGMGPFYLPFMAVVDPQNPDRAVARTSGEHTPAELLDWLRPYSPSASTALAAISWGQLKQQAMDSITDRTLEAQR